MEENKNSNLEIRNSKQYQMTKIQMIETVLFDIWFRECNLVCLFLSLGHYSFEFVSDFDIRISNLTPGLIVLGRAH